MSVSTTQAWRGPWDFPQGKPRNDISFDYKDRGIVLWVTRDTLIYFKFQTKFSWNISDNLCKQACSQSHSTEKYTFLSFQHFISLSQWDFWSGKANTLHLDGLRRIWEKYSFYFFISFLFCNIESGEHRALCEILKK